MASQLPSKSAAPNTANIQALRDGLTSVIATHPGAIEPWTFYEVLDDYLGPWKDKGYPIAYGKFYCERFNKNENLQRNRQTHEWVRKTTIALQESLRDFVVARFRAGTLATVTEAELRAFAFSAHPKAYVQGGLSMVVLTAPEMVPVIASIPGVEFWPTSENFGSTINQVIATMEIVLPQSTEMVLGALAGPAHSGIITHAILLDERNFQQEMALGRWLNDTGRRLSNGELDNVGLLKRLTTRLNATQFEDRGMAVAARRLVQAADERKRRVVNSYRELVSKNPSVEPYIDRLDPDWRNY